MELGKVYLITSNNLIDRIKLFFGWKKSFTLHLKPYSGKTTVEVCQIAQSGLNLIKDDSTEIVNAIEGNIKTYIEMIVTACKVPDNLKLIIMNSIADNWTLGEISVAAQSVYNNIDFQSAFEIMGIMGQLRFEDDL